MKNIVRFNQLDFEKVCIDFETKGWTKINPPENIKDVYFNFLKYSHEFFERQDLNKEKLVNPHGLAFPGYLVYPGGKDGYFQDTTQMYHVSLYDREVKSNTGLKSFTRYANVWPEFEEFEKYFKLLRDYFHSLSLTALECVEKYYEINSGDLTSLIENGWSLQRAMMYSPFKDESRVGSLTVGEHRDTSLLTITLGGSQPGLELKNEYGDWESLCGKEAQVVIGVGGMLEQISNGNFKNMFHRVKYVQETQEQARVSSPFFCWPKPEAILEPHPKILSRYNQIPRYQSQLAIRHLEQNLMVPFSYPDEQEAIDKFYQKKKKAA